MSHVHALAEIVGPEHCLTGHDLQPLLTDWRGRYRGTALCAVRPASTAEVAAVVRYCHEQGLPVVPQGGNTGLCGGATPQHDHAVVVCLGRLNRIRAVDPVNNTLTLEAGVILHAAQHAAEAVDRLFPLALASEGSCQIGGNLATNAGGVQVLRYGNMRELTLGLEVVLPNGEVWNGLRGLRKDNTGYDLKDLFIGAEGTLGIITAAVLKLFPQPRNLVTAWLAVDTPESAIAFLNCCQARFTHELTAFELVSGLSLHLVLHHVPGTRNPLPGPAPWYVLCEFSGLAENDGLKTNVETLLADALETGMLQSAVIAQSRQQAQQLRALRENISEAQKREGFSIKHDIAVPVSALPGFLSEMGAELETAYPGIRIVAFGHAGDGNLHYNLSHPAQAHDDRGAAFLEHQADINRRIHDRVHALNGSISAEHGIGQLKRDELLRYKDPVEMALMQRIKNALDPGGLMNPGKVLADPTTIEGRSGQPD